MARTAEQMFQKILQDNRIAKKAIKQLKGSRI